MIETPRICPYCGHNTFIATAHIVQEWEIDSHGDFIRVTQDCTEVIHSPHEDDIWYCAKCGKEYTEKD